MNISYTNTFRDLLAFQRYHQNGSRACQRRPARQSIEAMIPATPFHHPVAAESST